MPNLPDEDTDGLLAVNLATARALCDHVVATATDRGLTLAVSVSCGGAVLAQLTMDGAPIDLQEWLRRKANVVRRFGRSSRDVANAVAEDPGATLEVLGLDWRDYALVGGSVPIPVLGHSAMYVLTVTGAHPDEDHEIATLALDVIGNAAT